MESVRRGRKQEDRRQIVKVVVCHIVTNAVRKMCRQRERGSQGGEEGCNFTLSGQVRTH